MKRLKIISVLVLLGLFTPSVFAGGGRIRIQPQATETIVGQQAIVDAWLTTDSSMQGQNPRPSEFEQVEFKVENPRPGDVCVTIKPTSDSNGYVQGSCTSSSQGPMTVYVKSVSKNDESSRYILYFIQNAAPTMSYQNVNTDLPVPSVTNVPVQISKAPIVEYQNNSILQKIFHFFSSLFSRD